MKQNIKVLIFFVASLTLLMSLSFRTARAVGGWEVFFNESPSKMEVVETDSGPMVAVYFPVPERGRNQAYGVFLEADEQSGKLHIKRVKKKTPVRARGDCVKCEGSKDCQDCYPIGSGDSTSGGECWTCNATGDCSYCEGSGVCYTCDGHGFENGCNTCGEMSG